MALTSLTPIGLDAEEIREDRLRLPLDQMLSASEANLLGRCPASIRAEGFTRLWTRKEAYIKALGVAMGIYPARIDLSHTFDEFGSSRIASIEPTFEVTSCQIGDSSWTFHEGAVGDRFWMTLAFQNVSERTK